ncbi:hypothetical protein [Natronococcus sp.]|uniref:hypothetical protein n=1 Tax=Natronococcus sp. TaxID=35747 RepID=UPI003A4D4148
MSQSDSPDGLTEAQRRKRSKEVYDRVVSTVDKNSGGPQPPLAKQSSIFGSLHTAGYGPYGHDSIHNAMIAACSNGDLIRGKDRRGNPRLGINDGATLAEKLDSYLSGRDSSREDLVVLGIEAYVRVADEPDSELIGRANERLAQLRGDQDD